VGPVPQEWFLNIAVALRTELEPDALLAACQAIEADLGRRRAAEIRWGPRFIDIDIVAFAEVVRADPGLTLPHPRFAERGFVLVPLAEIAARVRIGGRTVAEYLAEVDAAGVEKLDWPVLAV
jgi:2-amino-4-hydroxy-6-hydroxymethyldihydropteridine diphosphokinase